MINIFLNKYFLVILIILISGCQASNQTKGDGRKVFQDRLKDGSLGPKMVSAGSFRMGDIQGD